MQLFSWHAVQKSEIQIFFWFQFNFNIIFFLMRRQLINMLFLKNINQIMIFFRYKWSWISIWFWFKSFLNIFYHDCKYLMISFSCKHIKWFSSYLTYFEWSVFIVFWWHVFMFLYIQLKLISELRQEQFISCHVHVIIIMNISW